MNKTGDVKMCECVGVRMQTINYLLLITYSLITSCGGNNGDQQMKLNGDSLKKHMITVNKIMVENESSRIAEFIQRHQWRMDSTGIGIRYWIYMKGNGAVPKSTDKVEIDYKLYLLDGTPVSHSEKDKPLTFTLGQGESTTGLEEALMLMHTGDKAWIIVPKYLGYGMTGNGDKIPGNSTLLYDVELISVN